MYYYLLLLSILVQHCYGLPTFNEKNETAGNYLHYLEARINSLEQPVWPITWDTDRWEKCSDSGPCICTRLTKIVNCWSLLEEPGLPSQQIIPWDIEWLDLGKNEINAIPSRAFQQLSRLFELSLFDLQLEYIPKYSFDHLVKLWHLKLNNNHIAFLENGLLRKLRQLKTLDISVNRILEIPEGFFEENENLVTVQLSHNKIKRLPDKVFLGAKSLKMLDLSHNNIESITGETFVNLNQLENLDLSFNKLTRVDGNAMQPLSSSTNLRVLDMSSNKIDTLARNVFCNLTKLELLNLGSNLLIEFNIDFVPKNLVELDVSKNLIEKLVTSTSSAFNLKRLNIGSNNLVQIPAGFFLPFTQLQVVQVGNNMLQQISLSELPTTIIDLNLSSNQLESLSAQDQMFLQENLSELRRLRLSNNMWKCNCDLQPLVRYINNVTGIVSQPESIECLSPPEHEYQGLLEVVLALQC